ncbi:MAG: hypothetical protein QXK37_05150 [Candidatus Woesearchaeota archaeon]
MQENFKKALVAELEELLGRVVAEAMIGQLMLKKKIFDLNSQNENFKINFVNELFDTMLAKFVREEKLSVIRQNVLTRLFDPDSAMDKGSPILPERDLYENDVVNDPIQFVIEVFGETGKDILRNRMPNKELQKKSIRERVLIVDSIIDHVLGNFYTRESLQKVHDSLIKYVKGQYKGKQLKLAVVSEIRAKEPPPLQESPITKTINEGVLNSNQPIKDDAPSLLVADTAFDDIIEDIDSETLKFLSSYLDSEQAKQIFALIKAKLGIYSLRYASVEQRLRFLQAIMDEYLGKSLSQSKLAMARSRLIYILGLRGVIE